MAQLEKNGGVEKLKNIELTILSSMFLVGMIYGVLALRTSGGNQTELMSVIAGEYTEMLSETTLWQSFTNAFFGMLTFVLLPYFLGFSAVAQPLLMLVPFFKGLGLGGFMAQMYLLHGGMGVLFCALIIVPYSVITVFCCIIANREALRLSNMFFASFAFKTHQAVSLSAIKLYHLKMAVLIAIGTSGAVFNVLCIWIFSSIFNF